MSDFEAPLFNDRYEVINVPSGYQGNFNGDADGSSNPGFALVTTAANSHGGIHALSAISLAGSPTAANPTISTNVSSCLDLSAFNAIRFWAKGTGELRLYFTGGDQQVVLGNLSASPNYQQFTVTWAQLGFTPPTLTPNPDARNFLWFINQVGGSLYLDDVSFVTVP